MKFWPRDYMGDTGHLSLAEHGPYQVLLCLAFMAEKHLRRPTVEEATGLSRSTIYEMMDRGEFPRPIRIGRRAVAWPESAVLTWLAERPTAQREG
jgi:prophage regulatory protein